MQISKINYSNAGVTFDGYLTSEGSTEGKRPAVLVVHDWSGLNTFAKEKAEQLAHLGYIGFAVDMFGNGVTATDKEAKSALIQPLVESRALLRDRITAALHKLQSLPNVDATRIAAIGFCFGGLCALDLARSGADIAGVVSFHGLLNAPTDLSNEKITAKILALHGHDDPMVPPDNVLTFEKEMTAAGADWQVHVYGNTMHGFTNPLANDPVFGTVYSKTVDNRAWGLMKLFLTEIFA